jgi:hypothetical protein
VQPPDPRWMLIDATVLARGEITCSICGKPFTAVAVTPDKPAPDLGDALKASVAKAARSKRS